jgi:hypothetical protein
MWAGGVPCCVIWVEGDKRRDLNQMLIGIASK